MDTSRIAETLADWRERYATSLVGRWRSETGTFAMQSVTIEVFADGTGRRIDASGRGDDVQAFRWRSVEPFAIAMRFVDDDEDDDDDDPTPERIARYAFRAVTNDVGTFAALDPLGDPLGLTLGPYPLVPVKGSREARGEAPP